MWTRATSSATATLLTRRSTIFSFAAKPRRRQTAATSSNLDYLTRRSPLDLTYSEGTEAQLSDIVGGLSAALIVAVLECIVCSWVTFDREKRRHENTPIS